MEGRGKRGRQRSLLEFEDRKVAAPTPDIEEITSIKVPVSAVRPFSPDEDSSVSDPSAGRIVKIDGKRVGASSLLSRSIDYMKSLQREDGYWWFALEANETIGAEFILLMHYLGEVDLEIQAGICQRILDVQRADGSWALYYDGPGDLSTTLECYFALKLGGLDIDDERMVRAREFILQMGGAEKARVFTRIHLAMFGIVPWTAAPAMPAEFIFLPKWFYVSIYSFSSWARAKQWA